MRYYILHIKDDNVETLNLKDDDFSVSLNKLEEGIDLSKSVIEEKTFEVPNNFCFRDWIGTFVPIVSKKLLDILLSLNCGDLQYFPINLKKEDGETIQYFIINYVTVLKGANSKKQSKIEKIRGLPDYVVIASIIENKTQGLDIFRINERERALFVSENVKKQIAKEKITGVEFMLQYTYPDGFLNRK